MWAWATDLPCAKLVNGRADGRPEGAAPAQDEELAVGGAVHVLQGDMVGDAGDLSGAIHHHLVMVGRGVIDVAGILGFFDAADAMLQAGRARNGPGTSALFITQVVFETIGGRFAIMPFPIFMAVRGCGSGGFRFAVRMHDGNGGQVRHARNAPGFGTIGKVTVGEQNYRGHEFDRNAHGFLGHREAIAGSGGSQDGHRAIAVAAEHRQEEVGLFRLGRGKPVLGHAALHIDNDHGQFGHETQAHRLTLEADARTTRGGDGDFTGESCPADTGHGGNLVFGLEGAHRRNFPSWTKQIVQDVAGGRNGVTAVKEAFADPLGTRQKTQGSRFCSR